MSLPTERISLNNRETAVVLSGLKRIVNEFATLQVTCRRAPDTINPWLKDKLQPRVLAPGSYEWILSLRNRLVSMADEKRAKFRFSVVDYAMLAFAVRVARRHCQTAATAKLEGKLEIYRKRAKRKTIATLGHQAYKAAAKSWLCSSRWIRFNLFPLPSARPISGKLRLRREQYDSLLRLAKESLMDRCTELPSEGVLCKLVELAAAEIRRRRHSEVRMREFIAHPVEARKFLFDFIKGRAEKRNLDLHLKPENQPYCVTAAQRGERFKAALVAHVPTPPRAAETPRSVASATPPAVQPLRSRVPQSPAIESESQVSVDDRAKASNVTTGEPRLTPKSVGDWLLKHLERDYWEDVIAEAHVQLPRRRINSQPSTASTIEAVQQACRPATESGDATETINSAVDWLLQWLLVFETNRARAHQILDAGLGVAKSTYKPAPVRRPAMNGFRRIEEIMKGNLNP